jgi:hypothetical protein
MRARFVRLLPIARRQPLVVLTSLILLPAVRLSLRLRGFGRTSNALAALSMTEPHEPDLTRTRQVADAVALVAGRRVVGAQCLARTLVLWFLLRRRGVDARFVLGADAPGPDGLSAHAWVEVADEPLNEPKDVRARFGQFDLQLPPLTSVNRR